MYNFDELIDRRNTNSVKWNCDEFELPMWIADMDFKTAPSVINALGKRLRNGAFGYNDIEDEWYQAIISWYHRRHNFNLEKEWLMFSTGVVASISSIVRKITNVAENVVILTPSYNIFYNSILNNGRNVLECDLLYKNGQYEIDFTDLENKFANPQTSLLILCNPHNPIGKIWDRKTLEKIGLLAHKHNVVVLSDEIHCDITYPGYEYVPFASVNDICKNNSITCIAPTKTFNLAGLQTSAIIVCNKALRHKVWRGINTDEVAEPNTFATLALISAFNEGEDWLDELRTYLFNNKEYVIKTLAQKLPDVYILPAEATYLLWLDFSKITDDTKELVQYLHKETGLHLAYGGTYGSCGKKFVRMNIATQKSRVEDGVERLILGVKKYLNK